MELNFIEESDHLTHLSMSGSLDIAGVGEVEMPFSTHVTSRRKHTIVDMSGVDFAGSLGMGMFVDAANALTRHNLKMILVNTNPNLAEAFRKSKLDQVVTFADSVDEAKQLLASTEPA